MKPLPQARIENTTGRLVSGRPGVRVPSPAPRSSRAEAERNGSTAADAGEAHGRREHPQGRVEASRALAGALGSTLCPHCGRPILRPDLPCPSCGVVPGVGAGCELVALGLPDARDPGERRIPFQPVAEIVERWLATNGVEPRHLWELVGTRCGSRYDSVARRWSFCRQRGWIGETLADLVFLEIDVRLDEVLPPVEISEPGIDAWCPRCREIVGTRHDGTCIWCDEQTGGGVVALPASAGTDSSRWVAHKGDPTYGPECPVCGGPKHVQALRCIECRREAGWRGVDVVQRRYRMPEDLLLEARALYAQGLSFLGVATALWERTDYKSVV